ncbi:MAG TPA: alpha-2-macroglobulin family protein [Flavitalea sp.]|nr:alpha-2-macroglobulin family protein [Flavitalea sp.]
MSLTHRVEAVNVPGKPFRALVEYRNAASFSYRIIRIEPSQRDSFNNRSWEEQFWKSIIARPFILQEKSSLPLTNDHQVHRAEIAVKSLPAGEYAMLTSASDDFRLDKSNPLALNRFTVSSISYIQSVSNYYVLDRNTGKPLAGATATVYELSQRNKNNIPAWTLLQKYTTNTNGHFSLPLNASDYSQKRIEFTYEKDKLLTDYERRYYSYNNDEFADGEGSEFEEQHRQAFLFTDRSIYRPGQEVFLKGIYVTRDAKMKRAKIVSGMKTMLRLVDANGESRDSIMVTTNEFGSVHGSFRLPAGLLNGEFTITDTATDASISISVEEYKRPKFAVELTAPTGRFRVNDTVTVNGMAKAFAGNFIGGAKLSYKVVRRTMLPMWVRFQFGKIWPPRGREETIITTGTATTNARGEFAIAFMAIPDPEIDPSTNPTFNYEVQATVIDINGESHTETITVIAGYKSIQLEMNGPTVFAADSLKQINITTKNLSGVFEKSLLTVTFSRLQAPANVYRKRYWQEPDQFVMSEKDFHQLFPTDEYRDEANPSRWKKTSEVVTLTDSSSIEGLFGLARPMQPGDYELKVSAVSRSGDTVTAKQFIQVIGDAPLPGASYTHLFTKQGVLKPNDKWPFQLSTNLQDLFLVKQFTINDSSAPAVVQSIKSGLKDPGFNIDQYGQARIDIAFVRDNRFYTQSLVMAIPDETKKLEISLSSFRSTVLPGSKENWKIKIAGSAGEKVSAEILTGMYDRSLDKFKPHNWQIPSIWNKPLLNTEFFAAGNFGLAEPLQRYIQPEEAQAFQKSYDQLSAIPQPMLQIKLRGQAAGIAVNPVTEQQDVVVTAYAKKESHSMSDSAITSPGKTSPVSPVRKDFRETAFFFPVLTTDSAGNTALSFTMPEAVTAWKWMTLANTKDLAFAYKESEIISQKQLMTQPNLPRFLREGDRVDLSTRIANLSGKEITGQVQLELIDPETNQSVDGWFRNVFPNQYFTVAAGESTVASFSLEIPYQYAKPVIYRFTASNDSVSDGEEGIIPVLLSKIMVTETATLPLFNQKTKQVKLEKLINSGNSETLTSQSLTVEFTTNPSWFAIQSLPHLAELRDGSAEQVFYRLYAGAVSRKIIESNPQIAAVYKQWKQSDTSMAGKLQQNEALKSVLLQQTPWVLEAKTESENIDRLSEMFSYWSVERHLLDAVSQLQVLQRGDGAFSWMNGGPADRFITQHIVIGIGRLMTMKALSMDVSKALNQVVANALLYLDAELMRDYGEEMKSPSKLTTIDPTQVQYLYLRSLFPSIAVPGKVFNAYTYYRKLSTTAWVKLGRQLQGMTAISLFRTGDKMNASRILKSLKENAITNEELGTYWKESNYGYAWHKSSISTQAMLIETFNTLTTDSSMIDRMKMWLIKNKQTNSWVGDKATADACYALLNSGNAWINSAPEVEIHLGSTKIKAADSGQQAGTGYFIKTIEGTKVKPEMGDISVFVKTPNVKQPMYGAVYWQYMEDIDKITASPSPVVLKKRLFIQRDSNSGTVYSELTENATLKVGDKITVRLDIRADRDLQYVHVSDMRASGLEPLTTLSGYTWKAGVGYYQVTRDASTDFYIDHLPKGTIQLEYQVVINNSGSFTNGISTVQCFYAPEFAGHSTSIRFHAEVE